MTEKKTVKKMAQQNARPGGGKSPDWAQGLRRLYDSVVEEPLPDNFAKLLDQLDKGGHD